MLSTSRPHMLQLDNSILEANPKLKNYVEYTVEINKPLIENKYWDTNFNTMVVLGPNIVL